MSETSVTAALSGLTEAEARAVELAREYIWNKLAIWEQLGGPIEECLSQQKTSK